MPQQTTILGLHAQTSIHAGTGQNTGIIDLPIQREGHNGWPCVFGSAVKGAMRVRAEQDFDTNSINTVFGPDTENAGDYASAIMISDARLVLFPVRSLTSQFKWVTCPAALQRLQEDMQRFGFNNIEIDEITINHSMDALTSRVMQNDLYLEEYRFKLDECNLDKSIQLLAKLMRQDNAEALLKEQLVVVSNDNFTHLVQHATPVNPHIAIESATKTVKTGALWYEETLPPETLLYVGIGAADARNGEAEFTASVVLSTITNLFQQQPWLQIGGNETVGMGWCSVRDLQPQQTEV